MRVRDEANDMGLYGSVILHGVTRPVASTAAAQRKLATAVLDLMIRHELLEVGAKSSAKPDRKGTFATGEHLDSGALKKVIWTHYAIEPSCLETEMAELVYTDTAGSFLGEKAKHKRDKIAVPHLDLSVFAKPLTFTDFWSITKFSATSIVEFNYADARITEEVHRIRRMDHPFIKDLEELWQCKVDSALVAG